MNLSIDNQICTLEDNFYNFKNIFLTCIYIGSSIFLSFIFASAIHYNIKQELILLMENNPYEYDFIEYSYKAIDISYISTEIQIENNYISIDLTPKGYVIMYYNQDNNYFCYYNDNNTLLKYSYLEAVARQYTQYYKIDNIFIQDNQQDNQQDKEREINQDKQSKDNQDNIFYNKKNKTHRVNDNKQIIKNTYKYLGKINNFFREIQDKQLNLKYIGYLDTNRESYQDIEQQIYCEYKDNQLNTNFSDNHTILIDFSNIDISNIYIDNPRDHYKCINYNTKFFNSIDLCKELVIIEKDLEEKKNITWNSYKKLT